MTLEDTTLQRRLDGVRSILTSGDINRIADLYTEDGQVLPPGSDVVTGRDTVADFWQGVRDTGVETIYIETLEVEDYGGAASRVGRATLGDADGETLGQVKFIGIWKEDDGSGKSIAISEFKHRCRAIDHRTSALFSHGAFSL